MENTKLMFAVEYFSDGSPTYNIYESEEKARVFVKEIGKDAIEIWSAEFNVDCIYMEEGEWNYNDVSNTYDASTRKSIDFLRFKICRDCDIQMRKTKEYSIEVIGGKEVNVRKWWIQDDLANDYEVDSEMMDTESEEWLNSLDDEERDVWDNFVNDLD